MCTTIRSGGAIAAAALALAFWPSAALAKTDVPPADATVAFDQGHQGGDVPDHFVGFSIEWTLIERYMGPDARQGFANLMRNLDTGVLRIGGGSQDNVPFNAAVPNANNVITPEDVASIRATLDLVNADSGDTPAWGTILGTEWRRSRCARSPRPTTPSASPSRASNPRSETRPAVAAWPGSSSERARPQLSDQPPEHAPERIPVGLRRVQPAWDH